ncbi:hypothetical protein QBC42DRAFT_94915 [Cladorrhinum samala]|uniref:PSI domain-containing protein n=1 Tax=Cladorrhinum samala TaxID=585594 RepID=A0AAV9HQK5_9PEZI|nr:hypothetical protein QBC42DRAFT_94915 [Cladorrhinum samala]
MTKIRGKKGEEEEGDDDSLILLRCWRQQSCSSCLDTSSCNWCPFTQSCTPNTYAIPLLAPAYDENICPYWAERWEVRTRPLGCQVSTITALSVIIAVLSTLAVAFLIWLILVSTRRLKRRITSGSTSWEDGEQTWLAYARSWRTWNPREWGSTSRTMRNHPSTISEQDPLLQASATRNSNSS